MLKKTAKRTSDGTYMFYVPALERELESLGNVVEVLIFPAMADCEYDPENEQNDNK